MRIVVLSDIHANLAALERVLDDLPSHDELYCLGDIVGYGPDPNEVVDALRTRNPTLVLAGNHDHAVVTGNLAGFVEYPEALSTTKRSAIQAIEWTRKHLTKTGHTIALFHGSPRDPLNEYIFPGTPSPILRELLKLSGSDVLLQGHTHVPMFFRTNSSTLLNPGSVGQPRDGDPRASYLIMDAEPGRVGHKVRRVQYDIARTSGAIVANGLPSFLAERLNVGV